MNEWEWQLLEDKPALDNITVDGVEFSKGERVRLRPHKGGDIMDVALAGKIGIIESIEQDYEGKIQVAIVMDDDKFLGLITRTDLLSYLRLHMPKSATPPEREFV